MNRRMKEKRIINCSFISFLYRTALMYFIWWALTDGSTYSLWAGLPFAAFASVFWCFLSAPVPVRLVALARFLIFFVWQSLQAGVDVALRVMRPSLPIDPAVISIPFRLPEGPARVLMADTLNLLPGTLCVRISGDMVEVHVLDKKSPTLDKARRLEDRLAAVFGHAIAPEGS